MREFILIVLLLLSSCSQKLITLNLESDESDSFSQESFLRWGQRSLASHEQTYQGVYHCYQKKYNKAFQYLLKETQVRPKDPEVWNQMATCYYLTGKITKALFFYNYALKLDPKYYPSLNNLGLIYLVQGKVNEAKTYFDLASNKGKNLVPQYNLAHIYLKYGRRELSQEILESLYQKSSKDPDILFSLSLVHISQGEVELAKKYLQRIPSSLEEQRPDLALVQAFILYQEKDFYRAKEMIEKASFFQFPHLKHKKNELKEQIAEQIKILEQEEKS